MVYLRTGPFGAVDGGMRLGLDLCLFFAGCGGSIFAKLLYGDLSTQSSAMEGIGKKHGQLLQPPQPSYSVCCVFLQVSVHLIFGKRTGEEIDYHASFLIT